VFQEIAGRIYSVSNSVESYMNLKTINSDLMQTIARLEEEKQIYRKQLELLTNPSESNVLELGMEVSTNNHYIPAKVVRNQINKKKNYITLDKGSTDGIKKDMGVLSHNGIVGVIMNVSSNFSIVIPVLNPDFRLNCKIKSGYYGPLHWDGNDPLYTHLEDLPPHADFQIGDTVYTSGYSNYFPPGIAVGTIISSFKQKNDDYNSLKIKLFTDFYTLSEVMIVDDTLKEERKIIEK
jgi:rod shape-determining protein MreC